MYRAATAMVVFALISCYYGVASARYIEADPIGVVPLAATPIIPMPNTPRPVTASDVARLHNLNHSYSYVRNNPLNYTDPLGLEPVGRIPDDPSQAAVFYNLPRGMRKPTGGCVVDCFLKRRVMCLPMRGAGMIGGLSVAAAGSFASWGATFPGLALPSAAIGGNTGDMICDTYFFEKSCEEECKTSCTAY